MRITVNSFLIVLFASFFVACTGVDTRYKDNAELEQPPKLTIDKQSAEQIAANEIEPQKRRHGKGLKSDVYLSESSPQEIKIKRTFDEAWSLMNQAIQSKDLKVADQDRSKGVYYVAYSGGGFLSNATSFFDNEKNNKTYLLKIEGQGEESKVTVHLASKDEQSSATSPIMPKDGDNDENSQDNSQKLIELLYDTLHDEVKDE